MKAQCAATLQATVEEGIFFDAKHRNNLKVLFSFNASREEIFFKIS
jgi:hypothetical protein